MPSNSAATHHIRSGDVPYESPVVRPASPTGSINTEYGPDETDPADRLLSDRELERKILANLRIDEQTDTEKVNEKGPLLLTFLVKSRGVQPGSQEERGWLPSVLIVLRLTPSH